MTSARFYSPILGISLIALSCTSQRNSCQQALPDQISALPSFIEKIRHTDPVCALAATERASSAPSGEKWRLWLLRAELLLDKSAATNQEASALKTELQRPEYRASMQEAEAAARLASLDGYFAQKASHWDDAEAAYQRAISGMSAVNDLCWVAELLVDQDAVVLTHYQDTERKVLELLTQAVPYVKSCPDRYWSDRIPFIQGNLYLQNSLFEKAAQSFGESLNLAQADHFSLLVQSSRGNGALASYNLGDTQRAVAEFAEIDRYYQGRKEALTQREIQDWGIHKGHWARAAAALGKGDEAMRLYKQALDLAIKIGDRTWAAMWQVELTSLNVDLGNYTQAENMNQEFVQSLDPACRTAETFDKCSNAANNAETAQFNAARLARFDSRPQEAEEHLTTLEGQLKHWKNAKLAWRVRRERALLSEQAGRIGLADLQFKAALDLADEARKAIAQDSYRITYFSQLTELYRDYVDFLARQNTAVKALSISEQGHARVLIEKLNKTAAIGMTDFQKLARAKDATVLSFSIGADHSYLWVTSPERVQLIRLPGVSLKKLTDLVKENTDQIRDQRKISENPAGRELYKLLIEPAAGLLRSERPLIVIPDGPLSSLNFETLVATDHDTPHYWLEKFVISSAPSFALLQPRPSHRLTPSRKILLIGKAHAENLAFLASVDIDEIAHLYPFENVSILGNDATPSHVLSEMQKGYSWVHFSTHAIAFPTSPLDSYVALSPDADRKDELSARDFEHMPPADLVILKACQTAGSDVPGEGLVGLSWAVLSSGTKNVVATLWPVEDSSSSVLMKSFYTYLHEGQPPSLALHNAKLDMLKNNALPFAWAGFQLYSL